MKNKKCSILSLIIAFLFLVIEGITVYIIHSSSILPHKYFILILGLIGIFTLFILLLLFIRGKNPQKPVGTFRLALSYIHIVPNQ